MDKEQLAADLHLIRRVLDQTRRRVDPQMIHAILWGALVLVWYPLMSWFELTKNQRGEITVSITALALGVGGSVVLGSVMNRKPRLTAANTELSRQLGKSVAVFVGTGTLLSMAMPALAHGAERFIPHVWGLLYALMLMTIGVFYSREVFWCGVPSLVATLFALHWPSYAGFILGPAMGLGCIVAGLIAERRVARLKRETVADADDVDGAH